jgi:hypothetical protein
LPGEITHRDEGPDDQEPAEPGSDHLDDEVLDPRQVEEEGFEEDKGPDRAGEVGVGFLDERNPRALGGIRGNGERARGDGLLAKVHGSLLDGGKTDPARKVRLSATRPGYKRFRMERAPTLWRAGKKRRQEKRR